MSDEKALLAAVWAEPHDDTPRLAYADWCAENGDEARAEFIRVQCELARLDEWGESPRKDELLQREQVLWKKHGKVWRAGLPSPLKVGLFRRGFPNPSQQTVKGTQFLKYPGSKLDAAPLWSFNLRGITSALLSEIARSPVLGRTEQIMFWRPLARITPESVEELVGSPNAGNLTTLWLMRLEVEDTGVLAFVRSAGLPHLTALYVGGNRLTNRAVQELGEWPGAERLQDLMLDDNALGDESMEVLATGPLGLGLKSLLIGGNPGITTAGLIRLIESPAADSLAVLNVVGSEAVTPEFAEALAASPRSRALRQLVLSDTRLGDRGVAALLDSPHLQNLRFLNVSACRLRPDGRVAKRLDATFGGYGSGFGGHRLKPAT
jgi:uncharacterized protein (TIGR02996 family)